MYRSKNLYRIIIAIGDAVLIFGGLLIALALRHPFDVETFSTALKALLSHNTLIAAVWLTTLYLFDFYEIPPLRRSMDLLARTVVVAVMIGAFGAIYFYVTPQSGVSPRTILFLNVIASGTLIYLWHFFIARLVSFHSFVPRIIIIGYRNELGELLKYYMKKTYFRISAFYAPDVQSREQLSPYDHFATKGIISDSNELKRIVEEEKVAYVIFALDMNQDADKVRSIFSYIPSRVNYMSFTHFFESLAARVPIECINEIWFIENIYRAERRIYESFKRLFDIVGSLVGCIIAAPFMVVIIGAIRLNSPGPAIFSQVRTGKDGRLFTLYKFRSMRMNSELDGAKLATQNDERATLVGSFLRYTHLDELPQFYNILRGDISFVGPRPERPEFIEVFREMIPFHHVRLMVKPGLTGWAQVYYHAPSSVPEARERLKYDLYYIKNSSFLLDLRILFKTAQMIVLHKKFH